MVKIMISETMVVIAPVNGNISHNNTIALNSTNSDRRNIIVTWLDTKTIDTPVISVSNEDFWEVFGSLLKPSINGSISSSE